MKTAEEYKAILKEIAELCEEALQKYLDKERLDFLLAGLITVKDMAYLADDLIEMRKRGKP